jgi:hypothetical protein
MALAMPATLAASHPSVVFARWIPMPLPLLLLL